MDNWIWIRDAEKNNLVVGTQARILYHVDPATLTAASGAVPAQTAPAPVFRLRLQELFYDLMMNTYFLLIFLFDFVDFNSLSLRLGYCLLMSFDSPHLGNILVRAISMYNNMT